MDALLEKLLSWGPVFFGVCLFAPMLAAVLNTYGFEAAFGVPSLTVTLPLGFVWGLVAKITGRWL
ncbi:MAG: hypothetical protein ABJ056_06020 [Halioglobus sp.]